MDELYVNNVSKTYNIVRAHPEPKGPRSVIYARTSLLSVSREILGLVENRLWEDNNWAADRSVA